MTGALSNHALADRIAALDWSATSLQHQLAVAAAVETLRKEPACVMLPFRSPSPALLQGAAYTPERRVTLVALDGTPLADALCSRNERWDWIVETVCEICRCDPEQVACEDDTVTVDGLPVLLCC